MADDTYVALPGGSYVQVPAGASPDQLSQLREKLSAQQAEKPRTGAVLPTGFKPAVAPTMALPDTGALTRESFRPIAAREQAPGSAALQSRTVIPALEYGSAAAGLAMPAIGASTIPGALTAIGRTALGSAAGAGLGGWGGRELGGIFGPKGREIGESLGAGIGGIVGGMRGAKGLDVPEGRWGILGRMLRGGEEKPPVVPIRQSPNFDPIAYRAGQRAGGIGQSIPSVAGSAPKVPVAAPTEMPNVMVAPEPQPTPAGVREGSAFSVPREQIPSMIQSGSAGAGDVFRSTGGKLIYEPRGVGIRNVKESVTIPEETAPKLERESFGENTHQITANVGGQHVGSVMYSLDPDRIATVDSSLMTDPFQGKGIGKQMYDKAIQDAAGRGAKEFRSGSNPEPAARSLWENYLAKKYPVEKMDGGFRIPLMTR